MNEPLEIHPASAAEKAQALDNLHDTWGRGLSREEHLRWRLGFAKHHNATWYVGCHHGRVVVGCGAYDFRLQLDGVIHGACALGEVHTVAELRGRGLASRLLAEVEADQRRRGKTIALLYSDIAAAYYERLGYVACPSLEGWKSDCMSPAMESDAATAPRWLACDPLRELDELGRFYDANHAALPLAVARSRSYWEYLIARSPGDEFFWLQGADGEKLGYVRLASTPAAIKLRDVVCLPAPGEIASSLYTAVIRLAASRGVPRVGGWMPDTPASRALFTLTPRRTEITMIKPLAPELALEAPHREAAGWFHEMDHV